MVPLGGRQENIDRDANKEIEINNKKVDTESAQDVGHGVYLRKYRTAPDDVTWARTGVVSTISNGEVISVVRSRITDAGFTYVEVVHLGADKVFLRSLAGLDVVSMLEKAREFFTYLFSNWERWEDKVTPVQRGAWVRLYGIPLQAWNESFFKLCVFDCSRFLRADKYTLDKDKLDFARVLIATSSLEVVKRVERLMVDDTVVDMQVRGQRVNAQSRVRQDHAHEDDGVIFSSKKRAHKPDRPGVSRQRVEHKGAKKRKGGGPLCHALFSLK
jgi:hypothetical protein